MEKMIYTRARAETWPGATGMLSALVDRDTAIDIMRFRGTATTLLSCIVMAGPSLTPR